MGDRIGGFALNVCLKRSGHTYHLQADVRDKAGDVPLPRSQQRLADGRPPVRPRLGRSAARPADRPAGDRLSGVGRQVRPQIRPQIQPQLHPLVCRTGWRDSPRPVRPCRSLANVGGAAIVIGPPDATPGPAGQSSCRLSSVVERRFRKAQVVSSSLTGGSEPLHSQGFFRWSGERGRRQSDSTRRRPTSPTCTSQPADLNRNPGIVGRCGRPSAVRGRTTRRPPTRRKFAAGGLRSANVTGEGRRPVDRTRTTDHRSGTHDDHAAR